MPQNLFTLELRLTECSYCVFGKADASISWEQPTPPQRAAAAEMEVGPREAEGAPAAAAVDAQRSAMLQRAPVAIFGSRVRLAGSGAMRELRNPLAVGAIDT